MRVNLYLQLRDIVSDFTHLLREKAFPVLRRETESDYRDFDESFTPLLPEKLVEQIASDVCTLCKRRISYKKNQFELKKRPLLPFLILLHNPFLGPSAEFYHEPEVNTLFKKMLETTLGAPPEKFLVREILRCHFSKEDVTNPEWLENCSKHIQEDIAEFGIRGILVMGQAAPLLFPDKNILLEKSGKVMELFGLPCLIMPGPNRLVYMREKKFSADKIDAERKTLFSLLNVFKSKIMSAGT